MRRDLPTRWITKVYGTNTTLGKDIKDYGRIVASAAITLTLPSPSVVYDNWECCIVNDSSGLVTLSCSNGFPNDLDAFYLPAGRSVQLHCGRDSSTGYVWDVYDSGGYDYYAPAAWTPGAGVVWNSAAPASITAVYRYVQIGPFAYFFNIDIQSADGDGMVLVSVTPPATPADIDSLMPCYGWHIQDTGGTPAVTTLQLYVDQEDGTAANRILKAHNWVTCVDAEGFRTCIAGIFTTA